MTIKRYGLHISSSMLTHETVSISLPKDLLCKSGTSSRVGNDNGNGTQASEPCLWSEMVDFATLYNCLYGTAGIGWRDNFDSQTQTQIANDELSSFLL